MVKQISADSGIPSVSSVSAGTGISPDLSLNLLKSGQVFVRLSFFFPQRLVRLCRARHWRWRLLLYGVLDVLYGVLDAELAETVAIDLACVEDIVHFVYVEDAADIICTYCFSRMSSIQVKALTAAGNPSVGIAKSTICRSSSAFTPSDTARRGCSARCRASAFRSTGSRRSRRFIGSATPASPPSTFTNIWSRTTVCLGLDVGEAVPATAGVAREGAAQGRASAQARAAAVAGDDAASGRLAARPARGSAGAWALSDNFGTDCTRHPFGATRRNSK